MIVQSEQDSNPLSLLLMEINQILKRYEKKKDIYKAVEAAFKRKEATVLSTTMNLWYKKYELEFEERSRTERRLTQTLEANKILSAQVVRASMPYINSTNREINTSLDVLSRCQSNITETPRKLLVSQKTEPMIDDPSSDKKNFLFQQFSSMEIVRDSDSVRTCPLCSQQLHSVYQDLEQKTQKIVEMKELIARMTHKGQILVSQAKMYTSENSRLEKLNHELQETMKLLEHHLTKTIGDNNKLRKSYLAIIDETRAENQALIEKVRHLEEAVKNNSQRHKLDQYLAHQSQKTEKREAAGHIENSSILVQRLLEENTEFHICNNELRQSLVAAKRELFEMSFSDRKLPETPTSGFFLDEVSNIHGNKLDPKMSTDDETIQKLLQGCIPSSPEDEANRTKVFKKSGTPRDKKASNSNVKFKTSASEKTLKSKNSAVQTRPSCECRLI